MSGSMNDSDRVFVRQFAKLIGGLIVLTVSLVTIAMMVHNHHPEATDPTAQAQVDARIAPVGAVYAGNTGRAAMQAAADAAAKAARVTLFRIHVAMALGGKGLCLMTGSVADVRAGVQAAVNEARKRGLLVSEVVIPRPSKELFAEFI